MKLFAIVAFALTALAEPVADPLSPQSVSILAVLATALPKSLLNLAITNSAAASSVIASEFAAGHTPAWFSSLPKNIQTHLVPVTTVKQAPSATPLKTVSVVPLHRPTGMHGTGGLKPTNATMRTHHLSKPTATKSKPSATSTKRATSKTSTAGASLPTAVIGYGLAGVVGLVGMLAL